MDPDFMDPKLLPKKANLGHLNTYKFYEIGTHSFPKGSIWIGNEQILFFPKIRAVFLASDAALH